MAEAAQRPASHNGVPESGPKPLAHHQHPALTNNYARPSIAYMVFEVRRTPCCRFGVPRSVSGFSADLSDSGETVGVQSRGIR